MHAMTARPTPTVDDDHRRNLTCSMVAPRTRSAIASKSPILTDSPARGTRRKRSQDQAAQRARSAGSQKPVAKLLAQTLDVDAARDQPLAVANLGQLRTFEVEFIANLAEQLLEHVFQRHQAEQLAELVDHQRHPHPLAADLVEQFSQRLARRNEDRRPDDAIDARWSRVEAPADQILRIEHADDIFRAAAINRDAREMAMDDLPENVIGRRVDVEHEDAIARRHDVAHAARREFEHPINHRALGRFNLAEIFTQPQQRLEFGFGNRLRTRRFFACNEVARERMYDLHQLRQRPRRDIGDAARKAEREGFRGDVAEEQHQGEHDRHSNIDAERTEPGQKENRPEAFGEHVGGFVQSDRHDQRLQWPPHQAIERRAHRRR